MKLSQIKKIIFKYRTLDLVFYVIDLVLMGIYRTYSTAIFRVKCCLRGLDVDSGCKIWGKVLIKKFPGSTIKAGKGLYIVSSPARYSMNIYSQSKLVTLRKTASINIGHSVGCNSINIMARSTSITIDDGTLIGGNCQIMDNDGHQLWPAHQRFDHPGVEADEPVYIGKNVFIGLNVIILKGVEIGDNSIIAAGSVVTSSIPENCIAGGVPAKVIKYNDVKNSNAVKQVDE